MPLLPYFTLCFLSLIASPSPILNCQNSHAHPRKKQEKENTNWKLSSPSLLSFKGPLDLESQVNLQDIPPLLSLSLSLCHNMDDFYRRSHVPAFGSWDWNNDLPFTQCFESARQAGLLRYSYSEDRDLYVAGDLYENDVVTPAMIVVPRRRTKVRQSHVKEGKKQNWEVSDVKEPASPTPLPRPTPKPVDEDLYKISPELLYAKPKKKRGLGFFSSCLVPTCAL